jgi:hypothetical protein
VLALLAALARVASGRSAGSRLLALVPVRLLAGLDWLVRLAAAVLVCCPA